MLKSQDRVSAFGSISPCRSGGGPRFVIRHSRFPNHSPLGIWNRESGIPMGLRPKVALGCRPVSWCAVAMSSRGGTLDGSGESTRRECRPARPDGGL